MIEILFMAIVATKQPSSPPPPTPPERIVAVIPRELELVTVKKERKLKEGKENVASPSPLMRKMAKILQAKRQLNRRGVRNK